MRETIESVKRQFEALSAKIDPMTAEMLNDRDYTAQLADCVAKTYVILNNGMCEELTVCHSCAQQRDYLHNAMETFEAAAQKGSVTPELERFYFAFVEQLGVIRANIEKVLSQL
jgi:hypothetical protein